MTTYSSLGIVKLSRTNFGFLTFAGLTVFTGFAGAFLTAVLVALGLTAAFLTTGFLAAGRLVAVTFFAGALAASFLAAGAAAVLDLTAA